jgi:hypothetical protein
MNDDKSSEKEAYEFMQQAYTDARERHELNIKTWQSDKIEEWKIDPVEGTIIFTLPTPIATGPVQIIGTLSENDSIDINGRSYNQTFMWAWGHPGVPENLQDAAYVVRDWGEKMGRPLLTVRTVPADENAATTRMYMVFNDLKFEKKES